MTATPTPTDLPEPLRLAALMDAMDYADTRAAAAELRRLHVENGRLSELCDSWNSECDEFREENKRLAALSAAAPAAPAGDTHAFKNFHRSLCGRFGYTHDDKDWRRDQVSLIEHIAKMTAPQAQQPTAPQEGAPAYDVAGVLHGLYEAANREAPGPTLRAITNAIQHLQAAEPQAGAESYPPIQRYYRGSDRMAPNAAGDWVAYDDHVKHLNAIALRARGAVPSDAIAPATSVLRELLSESDRTLLQRPERMQRVRTAVETLESAQATAAPAAVDQGEAMDDLKHCYWIMLRECESKADSEKDAVLRHQVDGFYRLWNRVTGQELVPVWAARAAKGQEGGDAP